MKKTLALAGVLGTMAVTVVWAAEARQDAATPAAAKPAAAKPVAAKPTGPAVPVDLGPVHNGFRLGKRIISGSCPYGDAGFKALKAQGVKTILSVDGAKPDLALAKKYGMRYVHIPIGYGGISREDQLTIARAVKELKGPVFIHCHHGIHRGPTAAVVAAMVNEGWTNEQAEAALKQAGTGGQYTGLWAVARDFKQPTKSEMKRADNSFPATAPVEAMAAAMVTIDERWVHLGDVRKAGWKVPADNPDVDPPHEALLLTEAFRELARSEEMKKYPADYMVQMRAAETAAQSLQDALRAKDHAKAQTAYEQVAASCKSCHAVYRDTAGAK